ncbi:hypothetical protein DU80_06415, partial [Methanosarcina mazei]
VRNFYKIERIVKSNWDKKEGKIKYQLVVTVKLRIYQKYQKNQYSITFFYNQYSISFLYPGFQTLCS